MALEALAAVCSTVSTHGGPEIRGAEDVVQLFAAHVVVTQVLRLEQQ